MIHKIYRTLARSHMVTSTAVILRNQLDHIIRYHFSNTFYAAENAQTRLLDVVGPRVHTFIDVGANIGEFTDALLQRAPKNCAGILMEPGRQAHQTLSDRYAATSQIKVIAAAAGSDAGTVDFFEQPGDTRKSSLVTSAAGHGAKSYPVEMKTIHAVVKDAGWFSVDFLKIDAEGTDFKVICGAEPLLQSKSIGMLQFEYNDSWRDVGSTLAQARVLLETHGYRIYLITARGLHPIKYLRWGEYFAYSNYLAVTPHLVPCLSSIIAEHY